MARQLQIGVVTVDSGTLLLGDPTYYTNDKWTQADYDKFVGGLKGSIGKIPHPTGRTGKGVLFSTGLGDGIYPVIAKYENIPGLGERLTEVKIEFNWKNSSKPVEENK